MLSSPIFAVVIFVTASQAQSAGAKGACVARGRGRTAERDATCYEFFSEERNWFEARNLQRWLETAIEQHLADRTGIWIGLNMGQGNGTYTWDDANGTGREARYFNWVNGKPNYGELGQNCVFMLKRFRWQWLNDECYSPYHGYSFVCEFGSSPNVSILTEATNPDLALPLEHVTEVVLSVGQERSSGGAPITFTMGLNAERDDEQRHPMVIENGVKDGAVFIAVGAIVLVAFAAGLPSIVWCHYRRQLKHSTSGGSQGTFTALVVSNPSGDTVIDPRDPTLGTSDEIREPLCSACRHQFERPTRDFSQYTECITNDEHTYAQLVEPWLHSDGVSSLSNAVQPVSTGLTEGQTESAHFETDLLVNCRYAVPTCTVDSIDTLVENAYVSIEPVVDHCSKADDTLLSPITGAACNVRDQPDTTSDCYCVNE